MRSSGFAVTMDLSPATLAVLFGVASAATWGAGDFTGGLATRRVNVFRVVLVSQAVGLVLIALLALALREPMPPISDFAWGAAAGLSGGVGVACLYAALATGRMGIAAPITAVVASIVPVSIGIATQGSPGLLAFSGFALALGGIWLVSRPTGEESSRRALVLAIVAGAGFGGFLVLIDQAESILWPLVGARTASSLVMAAVVLARPSPGGLPRSSWGLLALAGVLDTAGNAFFVLAAALGRLDAAAVLSGLYPAMTVLLARFFLKERLTPHQLVGLLVMLVSIVLIAW